MALCFITGIETLTMTEISAKIMGCCCDQPDHVFWEGLRRRLEVWVGNVTESSGLNGLLLYGNLEDKNAESNVDDGGLCSFREK